MKSAPQETRLECGYSRRSAIARYSSRRSLFEDVLRRTAIEAMVTTENKEGLRDDDHPLRAYPQQNNLCRGGTDTFRSCGNGCIDGTSWLFCNRTGDLGQIIKCWGAVTVNERETAVCFCNNPFLCREFE